MAAERGIEDSTIKVMGRWDSSAYQLLDYIRSPRFQMNAKFEMRMETDCNFLKHKAEN